MKRKFIISISMLILVISVIILANVLKNDNKKIKVGNNNSIKEIEQILNIESYKAKITVRVRSNKNENQYVIEQEVKKNLYERAKIESPNEIKGVELVFENNVLTIKNSKIGASKIYENYKNVGNNMLFVTDFISEYKEKNGKIEKNENETKLIIKTNDRYSSKKTLIINNKTLKPKEMLIQDNTQNLRVYILYNEIEFNI